MKDQVPETQALNERVTDAGDRESTVDLGLGPEANGISAAPSTNQLFDLEELRLSQDFASAMNVKKVLNTVPVRKPNRQTFTRVHPDDLFRLPTAVLHLKEEGEIFLVDPSLRAHLLGEITLIMLFTAITRHGDCFLWPIRMPGEDGRLDTWNQSALAAAELATQKWIRVVANRSLGAYDTLVATDNLPEPEWPDASFQELVSIAFKNRFITDVDHPVLRQLRGST